MKICITFFAFLLARSVCAQTGDSVVIEYYKNGNIKQKISLDQKGIKNGASFYYSEEGSLDSTISFSKPTG
jgi:antitoxin component YwqK of YwqJK toxin-antitoxin module